MGFLKIIAIGIGVLFIGIAVLLITVFGLLHFGSEGLPNPCGEDELISEAVSPSQAMKVVVFMRDCGATTSFSTHVSILDSSE